MTGLGIGFGEIVGMLILGGFFLAGVWVGIKVIGFRLKKRVGALEKEVREIITDLEEIDDEVVDLAEKLEATRSVAAPGAWKEER